MAEEIILGGKIQFDTGQATQSVKSWKSEIKAAKQELKAAADTYGELSTQAIAAARKVAELNDAMGDQQALIDKLNPDAKFAALAQGVQGAVGAFSALTGAMAAFGVDSENLEKTLVKVQGAMAMTQGINSLMEAKDGLKQMGAIVGGQLLKAFHALKAAIGATGIGLLVIALGTIVAYWDKIKGAVTGYNPEAQKALDIATKHRKAEEDKLADLILQENQLKLQGKSEKEILQMKIAQTAAVVNARKEEMLKQQETFKGQIEAEKRNKDILAGILKFTTMPLQLLVDGISKVASVFGKEFKFDIAKSLAGMVFDPDEAREKQKATLDAMAKGIKEMESQQAGLMLSLQAMDKQESDAAKTKRDEEIKRQKEYYAEIDRLAAESFAKRQKLREDAENLNRQLEEENLRRVLSSSQIALRNLEQEYNQRYAVLSAAGMSTLELDKWYQAEKEKIQAEEKARKEAADAAEQQKLQEGYNAELQRQINFAQTIINNESLSLEARRQTLDQYDQSVRESTRYSEEERTAILAANAQARMQLDQAEGQSRAQTLGQVMNVMGQVSGLLGRQTAVGKATAIAQTTIDTYQSATAAFKSMAGIPIVGKIQAVIAAAAAIRNGMANVKRIMQVQVPNAGGVSMPSVPSGVPSVTAPAPMQAQPQVSTTRLDAASINAVGDATAGRAYVLDSDVRSASERNTRLNRAARLG